MGIQIEIQVFTQWSCGFDKQRLATLMSRLSDPYTDIRRGAAEHHASYCNIILTLDGLQDVAFLSKLERETAENEERFEAATAVNCLSSAPQR